MAGAAGAPSGTARYSTAYKAGARGATMPKGLGELADTDPKIDAAYDAGQAGTPYEEFLQENGLAPTAGTAGSGAGSGGSSSSGSSSGGRSRAPRRSSSGPSLFRPTKGIPSPSAANPLAPLSAGPVPLAHAGAGLILGAIAYALVLSFVDYGPSGPKLWFKAKFLNQTTGTAAGAAKKTV